MADRRPGQGRYAHPEREQRWIAASVPTDAVLRASILDRYIVGTRLRLRRSERGAEVSFKFGQKVRDTPANPETVRLTNMYLSQDEYNALLALPACELRKTRSQATWSGRTFAIDRFHQRLEGLVLTEVELASDEPLLQMPPWAVKDVTFDDRFSGGALACATDEAISALLVSISQDDA